MRLSSTFFTLLVLTIVIMLALSNAEDTSTDAPRTVRTIRDVIPTTCPISVQHNFFVTFSYTAHVVTANNTVGAKFDETALYTTVTLQANERQMLTGLYRGLLGTCLDESRKIIIPKEISKLKSSPEMKAQGIDVEGSDVVFIVNVIGIEQFVDLFDTTDTNRDGCLTIDELTAYIKDTGKVPSHLIDAAAEKLFLADDKNGDGYVECSEFRSKKKFCNSNTLCTHAEAIRLERLRKERLERERREAARRAEEARIAAEKARIAAEKAEAERLEAERIAEEKRAIEAARLAEEKRKAEEEQRRAEEEQARLDALREAEEAEFAAPEPINPDDIEIDESENQ